VAASTGGAGAGGNGGAIHLLDLGHSLPVWLFAASVKFSQTISG
jgi:hypothetical protein